MAAPATPPPYDKSPLAAGKSATAERRIRPLDILSWIGIVLLLLIPLYLAIGAFLMERNKPEEKTETYYTSIQLIGPTQTQTTFYPSLENEDDSENAKMFALFQSMLENSTYVPGIPDEHSGKYEVIRFTNTGHEKYTFYFSTENEYAYFTAPDGMAFITEKNAAEYFLNSTYAYELYDQSTPPTLTSALTDVIIPTQLRWSYKTKDGTFSELTQYSSTNEIVEYHIANDIAFYFTREPTSCHLIIRDGDTNAVLIDQSSLADISLPQLTQGKILEFLIEATYAQSEDKLFAGQAVYSFKMKVVEAASFSLSGSDEVVFGNYQILSCLNVSNEQNLEILATPALNSQPIVFRRGDKVYAAIPADTVGSRDLTVKYGNISHTFRINILEKANATAHSKEASELRGDWEGALNGFLNGGATADSSGAFQFTPSGQFAPIVSDADRVIAFGDTLTVNGSKITDATLPFEYYVTSAAIKAPAAGIVLEIGENDLLGKYIILDHGCGLYTWYCGLSTVRADLSEQRVIAQGDELGLAGKTGLGFANENGVLMIATWGKQTLNPDALRSEGVPIQ